MATRIDIPGLDNLITLLTLLKSHGANADEVWDRVPYGKSTSSSGSLSPDAGKSFRQSLDEAKLCMDALNQVQAQLRRRIQTLRKSCIPLALEDGIKFLPNEVLGQIFEAGHYMTDNGMFGKHVSHVCQYFRQVSLRNPLLWSRIADFYTVDQLATFLSRSGHADLDVSIECTDQELRSAFGFIQRLRPHSDRWTQLRVRYKPPESGEAHIPTTARPGLQLPRLQHFYYDYHIDLSSWDLPSISHLHGYDRFLFPTQNFMSQLTSFEWITNQAAVFTEISQAIYSMSNLQLLSLTFVGCEEGVLSYLITENLTRHSVPIDTLQITFKYITYEWIIDRLYLLLSYLAPSTINLTMENVVDRGSDEPFYLFSRGVSFPFGSIINIRLLGVHRPDCDTPDPFPFLKELVRGCRIAHTIHIEADNTTFISIDDAPDVWTYYENLRHLRFTRCDRLAEWELRALVDNLMIGTTPGVGLKS